MKLKRSRMINFLVTEDEFEVIRIRAKKQNISVSELIRISVLKDAPLSASLNVSFEEMRDSICRTEDICRQLNQDSVFLQRSVMLLMRLSRYLIGKFHGINQEDVEKLIVEYMNLSNASIPSRPDVRFKLNDSVRDDSKV